MQHAEENGISIDGLTLESIRCAEDSRQEEARRHLFLSYFAREFLQSSWQFALVVWFSRYHPGQLYLISLYQATAHLFALTLVPRFSKYIDEAASSSTSSSWNRGNFASEFILAENACLLLVTIVVGLLLLVLGNDSDDSDASDDSILACFLIGLSCLFGAMAFVFYKVIHIAIERDWIVVMANQDGAWLQKTTVRLKQISLICQVAGPTITGKILSANGGFGWITACIILSSLTEYRCMNGVYQIASSLQPQPVLEQDRTPKIEVTNAPVEETKATAESTEDPPDAAATLSGTLFQKQIRLYFSQKMALAGLGLSLLYCNVLTFGGMMTTYLVSLDSISLTAIGVLQGVSSFAGLLGIFAYEQSQKKLALETTALVSIVWEFLCLTIAFCSVFVQQSNHAASLLIAGVIPSRIGLWAFDISVTQLFQKTVPPAVRGQVGGVQAGINAACEYLLFVLGMVYSDVSEFSKLVVLAYTSVGIAMALYVIGVFLPYQRGSRVEYQSVL